MKPVRWLSTPKPGWNPFLPTSRGVPGRLESRSHPHHQMPTGPTSRHLPCREYPSVFFCFPPFFLSHPVSPQYHTSSLCRGIKKKSITFSSIWPSPYGKLCHTHSMDSTPASMICHCVRPHNDFLFLCVFAAAVLSLLGFLIPSFLTKKSSCSYVRARRLDFT